MKEESRKFPQDLLEGFSKWLTAEFASRPIDFARGTRRTVDGAAVPIQSSSRSYCGSMKMRGSDASLRIALAVDALQLAGYTNKNACLTVSEYPSVAELDRTSTRRSDPMHRDSYRALERTRRRYTSQVRLYGTASLRQSVHGWLAAYRSDHDRSKQWYREQIEAFTALAEDGDARATVHVARLHHECGQLDRARQFYSQAQDSRVFANAPEPIRRAVIPWLERQIRNCDLGRGPDPNLEVRLQDIERDGRAV